MSKDKKQKKGKKANMAEAPARSAAKMAATEPKPKMSNKEFEKELEKLQVELVKMQEWVKVSGAKVCVLFEGLSLIHI